MPNQVYYYSNSFCNYIESTIFPFVRFVAITILISCLNVYYSHGQSTSDQTFILKDQIIPFENEVSEIGNPHFQKLGTFVADKKVIALGEATHGTREFFLYKSEFCKYLIKEHGIKTIIFESDFTGTQQINDFVVNGNGSAEESIWQMGFSGTTQEFIDFAKWVKAYNEGKNNLDKVVFYGCDMQYPALAASTIKDYLANRGVLNAELTKGLEKFYHFIPSLTGDDKAVIRKTVSSLATITFTDQEPNKRSLYLQGVRTLKQFVDYMDAQSSIFPAKQSDLRDRFMAENCEWIYNHNKNEKIVIWAHNEHIKKAEGSDGYFRMGIDLNKIFRDDYYGIFLDFYKGTMRSFDKNLKRNVPVELPAGKVGSTGEIFSRLQASAFFLDFKTAEKNSEIQKFLNTKIPSVFYGANFDTKRQPYYVSNVLANAYDAVVFFRQTSAASNINKD